MNRGESIYIPTLIGMKHFRISRTIYCLVLVDLILLCPAAAARPGPGFGNDRPRRAHFNGGRDEGIGLTLEENPAGMQSKGDAQQKRNSLVALPYAFYTPETKFAFGAGAIYSFRRAGDSPQERPSNLRLALTYTQLKQISAAFLPELYFDSELYFINGYCGFYKFPDKFWGIGSETPKSAEEDYEPIHFESRANVQRRIAPGLYLGLRYQYEYIELRETAPEGILRLGAVPGSRGGSAAGIGVIVNHDTRDNIYQPSRGFYNQICAVFFGTDLGGDHTFELLSIDLRKYIPLFGSHVLALQTYDSFIRGEPPFQMLNAIGSSSWMRGYYSGRYRDKNLVSFQAEYRLPIAWRLGAAGFAGFGDVSDRIENFRIDRLKYSLGIGLRLMFDRQERINARLDFGFGEDGNAGIYALVVEAF